MSSMGQTGPNSHTHPGLTFPQINGLRRGYTSSHSTPPPKPSPTPQQHQITYQTQPYTPQQPPPTTYPRHIFSNTTASPTPSVASVPNLSNGSSRHSTAQAAVQVARQHQQQQQQQHQQQQQQPQPQHQRTSQQRHISQHTGPSQSIAYLQQTMNQPVQQVSQQLPQPVQHQQQVPHTQTIQQAQAVQPPPIPQVQPPQPPVKPKDSNLISHPPPPHQPHPQAYPPQPPPPPPPPPPQQQQHAHQQPHQPQPHQQAHSQPHIKVQRQPSPVQPQSTAQTQSHPLPPPQPEPSVAPQEAQHDDDMDLDSQPESGDGEGHKLPDGTPFVPRSPMGSAMSAPPEGGSFPSLEAIHTYVMEYCTSVGYAVVIGRSKKTVPGLKKVLFVCDRAGKPPSRVSPEQRKRKTSSRKCNCQFGFFAIEQRTQWTIRYRPDQAHLVHNHGPSESPQLHPAARKLDSKMVAAVKSLKESGIGVTQTLEILKQQNPHVPLLPRDIYNARAAINRNPQKVEAELAEQRPAIYSKPAPTPEERIRSDLRRELGRTKEELAKLKEDSRKEIEQLKEKLKDKDKLIEKFEMFIDICNERVMVQRERLNDTGEAVNGTSAPSNET